MTDRLALTLFNHAIDAVVATMFSSPRLAWVMIFSPLALVPAFWSYL